MSLKKYTKMSVLSIFVFTVIFSSSIAITEAQEIPQEERMETLENSVRVLESQLSLVLTELNTVRSQRGEVGPSGRNGTDGEDGQDGCDGVDGQDGRDGENGRDGEDGQDGRDGRDGRDAVDGAAPVRWEEGPPCMLVRYAVNVPDRSCDTHAPDFPHEMGEFLIDRVAIMALCCKG